MNNERKDGGAAFPFAGPEGHVYNDQGMTTRDYFAAKAMQSLMLDRDFLLRGDASQVGDRAYEYADQMLKARSA